MPRTKGSTNKVRGELSATMYLLDQLESRINRLYKYVALLALATAFATLSIIIKK